MCGHGVSVGDLFLSLQAIRSGLLALPFPQAVATGEGYYLVWPKKRLNPQPVALLYHFLLEHIPAPFPDGLTRLGQPPK